MAIDFRYKSATAAKEKLDTHFIMLVKLYIGINLQPALVHYYRYAKLNFNS